MMLGIASRIKGQLPHLSKADLDTIDNVVRDILTAFSRGGPSHPNLSPPDQEDTTP
jgi:hypothetical protein